MFNEATQNIYKKSYDDYYKERRVLSDMFIQHDIGSAQQVNSPNFLIRAHQTEDKIDNPNKNNSIAIFDNLDLRENYAEIDGLRYPSDTVLIN